MYMSKIPAFYVSFDGVRLIRSETEGEGSDIKYYVVGNEFSVEIGGEIGVFASTSFGANEGGGYTEPFNFVYNAITSGKSFDVTIRILDPFKREGLM